MILENLVQHHTMHGDESTFLHARGESVAWLNHVALSSK